MNYFNSLSDMIGATDIYLLDQIMKDRYLAHDVILDAGCGSGRNLHWFLQNNMTIYGVDQDENAILSLQRKHPQAAERFRHAPVERQPFDSDSFDHIISSAVLHFARSTAHFHAMLAEMVRVLRPGGSLFIRMTSDIGIEDKVYQLGEGVYRIPDGSARFLLTRSLLTGLMEKHRLTYLEPLKTVNVDDVRCMSTLLLAKQ